MYGAYAILANVKVLDQFSADVFGIRDQHIRSSQCSWKFASQPGHSFRGVVVRVMHEGEVVDRRHARPFVGTQNKVGLVIYEIA